MLVPFGVRLKQVRESFGWTQTELARRSGVLQSTIAGLESGARAGLQAHTLRLLADAFGMPMDALAEGASLAESDSEVNNKDSPAFSY